MNPIVMLLLVTTVQVYMEAFAGEDGVVIGNLVSSKTGRNNNSGSDAIEVNNDGSLAIEGKE